MALYIFIEKSIFLAKSNTNIDKIENIYTYIFGIQIWYYIRTYFKHTYHILKFIIIKNEQLFLLLIILLS